MRDIIGPALAMRPEQLCDLVAAAVGDGDLDAAVSYYEPDALVAVTSAPHATGLAAITRMLSRSIDAKLAYSVTIEECLVTGRLALMVGRWHTDGLGSEGNRETASGTLTSIARRGTDGGWRVVVESLAPTSPRIPR